MSGRRRPSPPHPSLPLAWPPADPVVPPPSLSGTPMGLSRRPPPHQDRPGPGAPEGLQNPKRGVQAVLGPAAANRAGLLREELLVRPDRPRPARRAPQKFTSQSPHSGPGRVLRGETKQTPAVLAEGEPRKISVVPTPTLKAQLSVCHSLVTNRLNCCEFGKTHRDSLDTL